MFSAAFWLTSLYIIGGITIIVFFGEILFSKDKKNEEVSPWLKTMGMWIGIIFGILIILSYLLKFSKDLKSKLHFVPDVYIKTLNTWGIIIIIFFVLFFLFKFKSKIFKLKLEPKIPSIAKPEKIKVKASGEPLNDNYPPLSLLGDIPNDSASVDSNLTSRINDVFQDLELNIKVRNFTIGATITNVWLDVHKSVRIKNIMSVKDDIAMLLKVESVNIVNTKDGMLLEVPNKKRRTVTHREIMERLRAYKFKELSLVAGEKSTGEPYSFDLNQCPHLLVAGATGMGKSVCVNTLIATILLRKTPEELRFLLIDPKIVEFSAFETLPHLIRPVVKGVDGGIEALKWCVDEMERRYLILSDLKVKKLHDIPVDKRPFPLVVIIVDELADLILAVGKEIDELISRLAGKARAAGMHLILATQRPDSKILSGTIRDNILGRIALTTNKGTSSMVILDEPGAETLLGKGEMLVKIPGEPSLVRCQGSFIEDKNIESLVKWWVDNCGKPGAEPENNKNGGLLEKKVSDLVEESVVDDDDNIPEVQADSNDYDMLLRATICLEVIENTDDEEIFLPSIRNISESYNVTKYKIETLIDQLCKEGWIEKIKEKNNVRFVKNKIILNNEKAIKWLETNKDYLE